MEQVFASVLHHVSFELLLLGAWGGLQFIYSFIYLFLLNMVC